MFDYLQIYDRRERWMVGLADAGLAAATAVLRPFGRRLPVVEPPRRILLLRLERIGDLLMALPALAAVRRLAPQAHIDLVVGSWNLSIARLVRHVDAVRTLDARWLARGGAAPGFMTLLGSARAWRRHEYDVAINFEGDIRSHALMARSGARRLVGFDMAGGGPLLTDRVPYDPSRHVADNLLRLVERAFDLHPGALELTYERLEVPDDARQRAKALLDSETGPDTPPAAPLIAIQVGAGRQVKQWEPARFGRLARELVTRVGARVVFTGGDDDRALVDQALSHLPDRTAAIDLCGRVDLLALAALLERCAVFITGDTGPMHLAAAIGVPLVAIFGPSDPKRWGPLSHRAQIVYGDVDCRPCNRIRRPPARCTGAMPECLAAVTVEQVLNAVNRALTPTPEAANVRG